MKKLLVFCLFLLYISANAQPKYFEKSLAWEDIHNGHVIFEQANGDFFLGCDAYSLDFDNWHQYSLIVDKYGDIIDSVHYLLPEGYGTAFFDGVTT